MQLLLTGLTLPSSRPLIPIEAAMVLLDRNEDEVLAAVESGALAWAWDIRRSGAERREIRIWRDSILDVINGSQTRTESPVVYRSMIPPRPMRTPELQRAWSCSSSHLSHLIGDGLLRAIAPRASSSGPNAFARIPPATIREFLESRRVS
ncbi:MAG: hypothetical protein U1G08_17835 [Verrucomicrobiota bacterium]